MRCARLLAASCPLLLGIVTAASAQSVQLLDPSTPSSLPALVALSREQSRDLDRWLAAVEEWQRYDTKWHNRVVRDARGRVVARRPPPAPPDWLAAHCASAAAAGVVDVDARTAMACRLLADPRSPLESVPAVVQAARLDAEKPSKHSSFLTRVHLDGLWSTASTERRYYGIVGSHVSLVDVGRLQIFGPPGVLLLSVPDGGEDRRITLGYTWGVSLRLMDVRLFGPTENMTLFLNVSKVWVNASSGGRREAFDIAGFSLAPRKKR